MPVRLIPAKRFADARGWFQESYSQRAFEALGLDVVFRQDNHAFSFAAGTLRGLHFQRPPHAQAKLVRCIRGRIWDVAVDVRAGSPTWGKWVAAELSADTGLQIFVPVGFAHGYITLEPHSEIEYKVSDVYAADCEGGVVWNDPDIALPWPTPAGTPILSEKDQILPRLAALASPFVYDGVPLTPIEP
jgi:dTDP-4-dehydrorhamnose 3,5-epimerase